MCLEEQPAGWQPAKGLAVEKLAARATSESTGPWKYDTLCTLVYQALSLVLWCSLVFGRDTTGQRIDQHVQALWCTDGSHGQFCQSIIILPLYKKGHMQKQRWLIAAVAFLAIVALSTMDAAQVKVRLFRDNSMIGILVLACL